MKRSITVVLVLALSAVFVGAFAGGAMASDSDLDRKFNGGNVVRIDPTSTYWEDQANAVAIGLDGRIVVAGKACWQNPNESPFPCTSGYMRFRSDGSLDSTFGDQPFTKPGRAFGAQRGVTINGVAVTPQGNIVGVGSACSGNGSTCKLALEIIKDDGHTAFGNYGTTFNLAPYQSLSAVALQPDGKIVAVGSTCEGGGELGLTCNAVAVRFTKDGTLDPSFNGNGKAILYFGGNDDEATGVTIAPDGKIIVVGSECTFVPFFGDGSCAPQILRMTASGALDGSFNNGQGRQVLGPFFGAFTAVTVLPNLKIEAVGYVSDDRVSILVAKFGRNGGAETHYVYSSPQAHSNVSASSVAALPNGDVYVGGRWCQFQYDFCAFALVRFTGGLWPDTTFGENGLVVTSHAAGPLGASGMALQPNGKPVLAGTVCGTYSNSHWVYCDFGVVRYGDKGLVSKVDKVSGVVQGVVDLIKGLLP